MNRYASIVRAVVHDIAMQIERYLEQTPDASWKANDGKLVAVINGEEFEMTFEPGDPLTESLLMLLNNRALILSRLKDPTK